MNTQRTAAIEQPSPAAAERSAILKELDAREATIRGLLGETRQTLEAGTAMSNSLDATVKSLDAFMHYVSPPPKPGAPPAPAGKPFDVLDYGRTATDVAGMARELQTLLDSIDKSGPALAKVGAETGENLKRVVDHAFWRGLVLILVLLVGALVAALAYRALARRLLRRGVAAGMMRAADGGEPDGPRRGRARPPALAGAAQRLRPRPRSAPPATPAAATFVGRAACAGCHVEDRRWTGSHHDLAMQEATEKTVLGNFDGATFTHSASTTSQARREVLRPDRRPTASSRSTRRVHPASTRSSST